MPPRRSTSKKRSKRALASIDPDPPLSQESSLLQSIGSGAEDGEGESNGAETSVKLQEVAEGVVDSVKDALGKAKDLAQDATTGAAETRESQADGQEVQGEGTEENAESQASQVSSRGRRSKGKGKAKEAKEPAPKKDSRGGRKRKRKDAEESAEEPVTTEGAEGGSIASQQAGASNSVSDAASSSSSNLTPFTNRFGSLRGNASLLNFSKIFDRTPSSSSSANGSGNAIYRSQTSSDLSRPQQSTSSSEKTGGLAKRLFGGIFSRPNKKVKVQHEQKPSDSPALSEVIDEDKSTSTLYPDTTKLEQEQKARLGELNSQSAEAGPLVPSIYPALPQVASSLAGESKQDTKMPDAQEEAGPTPEPASKSPNGRGKKGKAKEDNSAPSTQHDSHSSGDSATSSTAPRRPATPNGRNKSPKSPHLSLLTPDGKLARNSRSRAVLLANQKEREKAIEGQESQPAGGKEDGFSQELGKQQDADVDGSDAQLATKEEVEYPDFLGADESRGLIALLDGRRGTNGSGIAETPNESAETQPAAASFQQAESATLDESPRPDAQGTAQGEPITQSGPEGETEPVDGGEGMILSDEFEQRRDLGSAGATEEAFGSTEAEAQDVAEEEEDGDDEQILISGPGIPSSQNVQISGENHDEEPEAETTTGNEDTGELIDRSHYDENGVALVNGFGEADPDGFDEILFADEADEAKSPILSEEADKENQHYESDKRSNAISRQDSARPPLEAIDLTGESDEDEENVQPQIENEEEDFEEQEDEIILKPSQLPRKPSSTALRGPLARSLSSKHLADTSLNESFDHMSIRRQQQKADYSFDPDVSATDMIAAIGASVIYKSPYRAKVMLNRKQPRRKRDPIGLKEVRPECSLDEN